MSIFIPLITLILTMLTQALLQLSPATFSIFYHYAIGKKSAKSASDLSLYYILGCEVFFALFFTIIYLIISAIFCNLPESAFNIFIFVMAGISAALGIFSFFFYFKKGKTAALYLPRPTARKLTDCAKSVKKKSDAFFLGAFTNTLETIFTIPLIIILSITLNCLKNYTFPSCLFVFIFIIITILPLIIMRSVFKSGHNFAEVTRFRIQHKNIFRILISLGFILTAITTLLLGVLNG